MLSTPIDARSLVGDSDILMVTLDTLRLDVAAEQMASGATPNLARLVGRWEHRHTPASFTYAAHLAFFAGFLPTPASPGPHPRLFAVKFAGSESTAETTAVFDAPDLVQGLRVCCEPSQAVRSGLVLFDQRAFDFAICGTEGANRNFCTVKNIVDSGQTCLCRRQ